MPARTIFSLPRVRNTAQRAAALARPALLQLTAFAVSLLAARAPLFGTLRPLGLALAAAAPAPYSLAAAAGAAAGYATVFAADAGAPYLAAVAALASMRLLGGAVRRKTGGVLPGAAAAVCLLAAGTLLSLAEGGGAREVLYRAAESALVYGMAQLLRTAFAAPWRVQDAQPAPEVRAARLFVLLTAVASLAPYAALGLNAGHIFGAAAALFCALAGRERAAAPAGLAVCAALAAAAPKALFAGFGIAVAALAAGFFLQENRGVTTLVFCGAGLVAVPLAPAPAAGLLYVAELCGGAVLVFLLPQKYFCAVPVGAGVGRASLAALSGRLEQLAEALSHVGTTLEAVCEHMPKQGESYADVCDAVTAAVCGQCPRNAACWTAGSSGAFDAMNALQPVLAQRGYVTAADIPQPLQAQCRMPGRLTAALSTAYRAWLERRSACTRSRSVRSALTEQYSAMASAVAGLAGQVYREEMPDGRKARRVEKLFCELGAEPLEVSVATDTQGCLHADVRLPRTEFTARELHDITQEVSQECRCRFAPARMEHAYASTLLHFAQPQLLAPVFGVCSLPARGRICADVCKTFTDVRGCAHALVCDGMGTGKAAAVDGSLAACLIEQLLSAGFGAPEAARLVNVALSLKGDSEGAAALDTVSVSLYSGRAELFKAGGAASFLVRAGSVTVLAGESLPIGILGSVTGRASALQLQPDDLLVLASDGAVAAGTAWLAAALASAADVPPQILAQRLAAQAQARAAQPDDITVLCLRLAAA